MTKLVTTPSVMLSESVASMDIAYFQERYRGRVLDKLLPCEIFADIERLNLLDKQQAFIDVHRAGARAWLSWLLEDCLIRLAQQGLQH